MIVGARLQHRHLGRPLRHELVAAGDADEPDAARRRACLRALEARGAAGRVLRARRAMSRRRWTQMRAAAPLSLDIRRRPGRPSSSRAAAAGAGLRRARWRRSSAQARRVIDPAFIARGALRRLQIGRRGRWWRDGHHHRRIPGRTSLLGRPRAVGQRAVDRRAEGQPGPRRGVFADRPRGDRLRHLHRHDDGASSRASTASTWRA